MKAVTSAAVGLNSHRVDIKGIFRPGFSGPPPARKRTADQTLKSPGTAGPLVATAAVARCMAASQWSDGSIGHIGESNPDPNRAGKRGTAGLRRLDGAVTLVSPKPKQPRSLRHAWL